MNKEFFRIIASSDFSFANCENYGTQLGYIILLTDKSKRISWLSYANYKCRGVVRSVLGEEKYAMADCFDTAYILKYDLERMLGMKIPITILTIRESFQNYGQIYYYHRKRLMIDVRAAREAFENGEISNIGWIGSTENATDGLTKLKQCVAVETLLASGIINTQVKQWIEVDTTSEVYLNARFLTKRVSLSVDDTEHNVNDNGTLLDEQYQ